MNDEDFAELFRQLSSGRAATTSWQDVRAEFEALGNTLGDVIRVAWRSQDADSAVGRLRRVLSTVTEELNQTVEGTPEAQRAHERFVRLRDSLRKAAEDAGDEVRPELLRMLRQANAELRRWSRLDEDSTHS
jgi:hypothetical protein